MLSWQEGIAACKEDTCGFGSLKSRNLRSATVVSSSATWSANRVGTNVEP